MNVDVSVVIPTVIALFTAVGAMIVAVTKFLDNRSSAAVAAFKEDSNKQINQMRVDYDSQISALHYEIGDLEKRLNDMVNGQSQARSLIFEAYRLYPDKSCLEKLEEAMKVLR